MMKADIRSRQDLALLLENFYQKLLADDSINYIFTDVAQIDMAKHLPVITDFWEMVLFHKDSYRKNAIQVHQELHQRTTFTKAHFDTWLRHFNHTVHEMFEGPLANQAIQRAASIAMVMQMKLLHP